MHVLFGFGIACLILLGIAVLACAVVVILAMMFFPDPCDTEETNDI